MLPQCTYTFTTRTLHCAEIKAHKGFLHAITKYYGKHSMSIFRIFLKCSWTWKMSHCLSMMMETSNRQHFWYFKLYNEIVRQHWDRWSKSLFLEASLDKFWDIDWWLVCSYFLLQIMMNILQLASLQHMSKMQTSFLMCEMEGQFIISFQLIA